MNIYFPQWQGSGKTDEIKQGAELIRDFYGLDKFTEIPLSDKPLVQENSIFGYWALIEQMTTFRNTLSEKKPTTTFTVGGDCGLEIIPVSYLNNLYHGNLGVLWFDAHADINTPHQSPSKNFHGMPLRTLIGNGNEEFDRLMFSHILPSQLHYIGLREPDIPEQKYIQDNNIFNTRYGVFSDLSQRLKEHNLHNLYIHLDLDVLEPSQFAHTKYRVSKGLSIDGVRSMIKDLNSNFNIVGASVLESTATNMMDLQPIQDLLVEFGNVTEA